MNTEQLNTKEKVLRDSFGWIADRENANLEIKEYHFGEYPDSVQRPKIYQAMQDFASQESKRAVDEFKEKLEKHVKTLHSKNKKQYDRDDWENLEMTPATYKGSMFACDEILDLIDKL